MKPSPYLTLRLSIMNLLANQPVDPGELKKLTNRLKKLNKLNPTHVEYDYDSLKAFEKRLAKK